MRTKSAFAQGAKTDRPGGLLAPIGMALLATGIMALGPQAAQADQARLTGHELRQLVPGSTVQGTSDGINDITVRFATDGTVVGRAENILLVDEDQGVWEIENDTLCLTWTSWADAERRCLTVERRGDSYESYTEDGSQRSVFRLQKTSTQVGDTGDPLEEFYRISSDPASFDR